MNKFSKLTNQGFTLVELMIVVAIIGILSAIAVPNFRKYQAKSKTSEAKIQLAAAYTAEISFYADFDTYHTCLKYMGFNPMNESNQRFYAIGFSALVTGAAAGTPDALAQSNGAVIGATACATASPVDVARFGAGKSLGALRLATAASFNASTAGSATAIAEDTFIMAAFGLVDKQYIDVTGATEGSGFTMNESKFIIQRTPGY